jgi:hypothetical protein
MASFITKVFNIKQIVYHFHHHFFVKSIPIEQNLNNIFANKDAKIQC